MGGLSGMLAGILVVASGVTIAAAGGKAAELQEGGEETDSRTSRTGRWEAVRGGS